MRSPKSSNLITLFGPIGVLLVIALLWRLMTRPFQEQMKRAQHNGITFQGAEPAPVQQAGNLKIAMHHELAKAAEQGQWGPIERQLTAGMNPDEHMDGRTLLMIAAQTGHQDLIGRLLSRGSKVDARDGHGNTALLYAARYGRTDAARFLLDHGADPHTTNGYKLDALDMAVAGQHAQTYALLKERGVRVNLLQAAQMDDRAQLDALLKQGADVNALASSLAPPLPPAHGDEGLNWPAFANFAGPGITDGREFSPPLAGAAETGHLEAARFLLSHGANLEQPNRQGRTTLKNAVRYGNLEAVQFFLSHGAKVDPRTVDEAAVDAKFGGATNRAILQLLSKVQAQNRLSRTR